jgi:hypothetical protein
MERDERVARFLVSDLTQALGSLLTAGARPDADEAVPTMAAYARSTLRSVVQRMGADLNAAAAACAKAALAPVPSDPVKASPKASPKATGWAGRVFAELGIVGRRSTITLRAAKAYARRYDVEYIDADEDDPTAMVPVGRLIDYLSALAPVPSDPVEG